MIVKYDVRLNEDRLPALIKECTVVYQNSIRLDCPEKIAEFLNERIDMDRRCREIMVALFFDTCMELIGYVQISEGLVNMAYTTPREIYQVALAAGAVFIALAHNHPSGNVIPSPDDHNFLKRMQKAGDMIGIPIQDFLIIGKNSFYSACESGDM